MSSTSVNIDAARTVQHGSRGAPYASELSRLVKEQVHDHPYRSLAVAAGVGFVLGAGLLTRATGRLVAAGLRIGMAAVAAPIATQIVEQLRSARAQRRYAQ